MNDRQNKAQHAEITSAKQPSLLGWLGLCLSVFIFSVLGGTSHVAALDRQTVLMVVWRGCEEACQASKIISRTMTYRWMSLSVTRNRDKTKLNDLLEAAKAMSPDLVVTWGTSVSKAMIGTREKYGKQTKLGNIPVLFMIVADPVGAGIIGQSGKSGRPTVAGIRNRVSEDVQIRAMREYFPVDKIGVLYSTAELNSVLNTAQLQSLAAQMQFDVVEATYDLDKNSKPFPNQFDTKMKTLADQGVDVVYVGSSSYNLTHQDAFTQAALAHNLPVASAYDAMVTDSSALISVSNKYYLVGQLAADQASKILLDGISPGDLPIAELSSYAMSINMDVARQLNRFPPIQLIRFANLVHVDDSTHP